MKRKIKNGDRLQVVKWFNDGITTDDFLKVISVKENVAIVELEMFEHIKPFEMDLVDLYEHCEIVG